MKDWTGNCKEQSPAPRKAGTKTGSPKKATKSGGGKPSSKSAAKQY